MHQGTPQVFGCLHFGEEGGGVVMIGLLFQLVMLVAQTWMQIEIPRVVEC